MRDLLRYSHTLHKPYIDFSYEERAQLNSIIDLLIPADENFPPPSSLHLLDEFLQHLLPSTDYQTTSMLNERRLRAILRDLNAAAGGNFRQARPEKQQTLLKHLERRDPALFEALWTLVNHSYYTHLAKEQCLPT